MADLHTTIDIRFAELTTVGEQLVQQFDNNYAVEWRQRADTISWILSAVHLLEIALPQSSRHLAEAKRLLPKADETIFPERIANILGILRSAQAEWSRDLILDLEYRFVGPAFEEFLKHAAEYLAAGRQMEAAILSSAVLEDTVKKVSRKFDIDVSEKELDALINALSAKGSLPRSRHNG